MVNTKDLIRSHEAKIESQLANIIALEKNSDRDTKIINRNEAQMVIAKDLIRSQEAKILALKTD